MNNPLISVIIPCHNSKPEELRAAIDAMLAQTYKNLEIIIIDDHSENDIKEIVQPYLEKYPFIRFARSPYDDPERINVKGVNINAGWQARNYGMEISRGELITFQDDDDGSCSNRIEFQYQTMQKYNVMHVNVDWQQYREEYNGKFLDYQPTEKDFIPTEEILALAKKTRPKLFQHPFPRLPYKNIAEKILRKIDSKYLVDWTSYPGCSGIPLFKREVLSRCRFRQAYERTRPSEKGRGADRDFNFWVAETFKSSLTVKIPLYLWRVNIQNNDYLDNKYRPTV